jgi:putative ABC transport system substrate-binding protein
MRRRRFITLLGGAAVWPIAARAQQRGSIRSIGIFGGQAADDPASQTEIAAFLQGLQQVGWTVGRNLRIDYRGLGQFDIARKRKDAAELIALTPDVILVIGDSNVGWLLEATRTVPIVFTLVPDPIGAGFVASLAHPGGNITGFTNFEYGTSGKWLELLKQIAPGVTRAAVLRDPSLFSAGGMLGAIQALAPTLKSEVSPIDVRNADEIERAISEFAARPNGGLIALPNGSTWAHREQIIALAARHRLPAVYPFRLFAGGGGLISYGPDDIDQFWRAADYVDRILKGEKAGDLPVQNPTKYETAINLKTAKALGLTVPPNLLAIADEVIE